MAEKFVVKWDSAAGGKGVFIAEDAGEAADYTQHLLVSNSRLHVVIDRMEDEDDR